MAESVTIDEKVTEILNAASRHDNTALETYLDTYTFDDCAPVNILDITTGRSPLHLAIASCSIVNGESAHDNEEDLREEKACDTVNLLLENGAIWNQLDKNNETPGCIARRLGLLKLYDLMVDAGVRAEILLNRLDGYEVLDDNSEEGAGDEDDGTEHNPTNGDSETNGVSEDVNSKAYLSSTLSFDQDKLLDDQANGVMMAWERDIMKNSAEAINNQPGLQVLNIGAGMLIFDTFIQESNNKPTEHHIVEAHPDVLSNLERLGWSSKAGVTIHTGKWQDVLPSLIAAGQTFDAIYFDTFAESYSDFKTFFSEYVVELLSPDGQWSYFNGMGADRQISYDVYQKVVEMDLLESGFDVDWQEMDIPTLEKEWEGVKRSYWNIDTYRLPICRYMN